MAKLSFQDRDTIEWLAGLHEDAPQTWIGKMLAAGRVLIVETHTHDGATGAGVFAPIREDFEPVLRDIERGWI